MELSRQIWGPAHPGEAAGQETRATAGNAGRRREATSGWSWAWVEPFFQSHQSPVLRVLRLSPVYFWLRLFLGLRLEDEDQRNLERLLVAGGEQREPRECSCVPVGPSYSDQITRTTHTKNPKTGRHSLRVPMSCKGRVVANRWISRGPRDVCSFGGKQQRRVGQGLGETQALGCVYETSALC